MFRLLKNQRLDCLPMIYFTQNQLVDTGYSQAEIEVSLSCCVSCCYVYPSKNVPMVKCTADSHNVNATLQKCLCALTKGDFIILSNTWGPSPTLLTTLVPLPLQANLQEPLEGQNTCGSTDPHPRSTRRPRTWKMEWGGVIHQTEECCPLPLSAAVTSPIFGYLAPGITR